MIIIMPIVNNQPGGGQINYTPKALNQWSEANFIYVPPAGTTSVRFRFVRMLPDQSSAHNATAAVWVDNVEVRRGIFFNSPPTAKVPFNGARVRIDALGNWSYLENGQWVDWVPNCISGKIASVRTD